MDKFQDIIDKVFDFMKFVWKIRHENKSIVVIRCWYLIAIALIGTYSFSLYADSNNTWHFRLSTPELGLCELALFVVASITACVILYYMNINDYSNSITPKIERLENNTSKSLDNTESILKLLQSNDSIEIRRIMPELKIAIESLKVRTAFSLLKKIIAVR